MPAAFADELGEVKHDFQVANNGKSIIRIKEVAHSCGCLKTELGSMEVPPGACTTLRVHASLKGKTGQQYVCCRLTDEADKTWEFGIRVMIFDRAGFLPSDVTFGLINPNDEALRTVAFYACTLPGKELGHIVAVESSSREIDITSGTTTIETLPGGARKRKSDLELRLRPENTPGPGSADVIVTFQDQGESRRAMLHLRWCVRSLYVLSPGRAFFGDIGQATQPLKRNVSLRRGDGQPLIIRSIKSAAGGLTAATKTGVALQEHQLALTLDPSKVGDSIWNEVVVETDHPLQPVLKIPFSAYRKSSE